MNETKKINQKRAWTNDTSPKRQGSLTHLPRIGVLSGERSRRSTVGRRVADSWPTAHRCFGRHISECDRIRCHYRKKKSIYENHKTKRKKNRLTLSFDWIPTKFGADGFIKFGAKRLEAWVTVRVSENCSGKTPVGNQVIPYSVVCLVAKCLDHFQHIRPGQKASTILQRTKVNIKVMS